MALPRGCLAEAKDLLTDHKIKVDLSDERYAGTSLEANFHSGLPSHQEDAVTGIGDHYDGLLCATAFANAAVAAWLIAKRKVNTVILVHRQQLHDQWHERLTKFLGLSRNSLGQIGREYRTEAV